MNINVVHDWLVFTDQVDQILRMLEAARNLSSILVSWQEQKRKRTCLKENRELRFYCHHSEPCGHFFFHCFYIIKAVFYSTE